VTPAARLALPILCLALSLTGTRTRADDVGVVSAKSAITTLSADQVADIFLGKMSRYPNGILAVPVDLSDGSAERDQFYAKVAGRTPSQIKAYWSKIIFTGRGQPPKTVPNDLDMKKYVAANVAAIGYIDEKMVDNTLRVLH
jgi:ABC-type phosphate transport system substrate-binding protein